MEVIHMTRKKSVSRKRSGGRKKPPVISEPANPTISSKQQAYKRDLWESIGKFHYGGRIVYRAHGNAEEGWVWRFRRAAKDYTYTLAISPATNTDNEPILGQWEARLWKGPIRSQSVVLMSRSSKEEVRDWCQHQINKGMDPKEVWQSMWGTGRTKPWERDPHYKERSPSYGA
jgi:hypothetical protein